MIYWVGLYSKRNIRSDQNEKKKALVLALAAVIIIMGIPNSLLAANSNTPLDIVIGNQVVLRVRAAADGQSIQKRSNIIYENLREVLSHTAIYPELTKAVEYDGDYAVVAPSYSDLNAEEKAELKAATTFNPETMNLIARVKKEDAKAAGMSKKALAMSWARNIARALPTANYEPNMCIIQPGSCPTPSYKK